MQVRCQNCHRPFALSKEVVNAALDAMAAQHLEHFYNLLAALIVRQHAPHGRADHAVRMFGQLVAQRDALQAARVSGMMVVHLIRQFLPGDADLRGVDDNHAVAELHARREGGLVFADQDGRHLARQAPQHLVAGVDDKPFPLNFGCFRDICFFHG